jgi:predicted peroxiredoxin
MANDMLYVGTHGPEDPTRATLVFAAATAMKTLHPEVPVRVALLGQGSLLVDERIASGIKVAGTRKNANILQMIQAALSLKIEIHC